MRQITLGKSDLNVPTIGLGCMRMADKSAEEATKIIENALTLGVNFFDHADIYGAGKSEEIFAEAMQIGNWNREDVILQSKVGIRPGMFDFSKEYIVEAVEGILSRLQTEYLDVLLLHRPDALVEPEEVAAAFSQLEAQGKVRHFGVSNQNHMQMELLRRAIDQPLIVNQLQFGLMHTPLIDSGIRVNMTDDKAVLGEAGTLDYCRLHDVTIQAWSPFMYGFFEGIFIDNDQFPELNEKLLALANKYAVDKSAIAIAWILRHPAKIQPIIGTMTPSRLTKISDAVNITLTRQEWYELYLAAGNTLP